MLSVNKTDNELTILTDKKKMQHNHNLLDIKSFLETLSIPPHISDLQCTQFIKRALEFFIIGNKLWHKEPNRQHQLVLFTPDHHHILKATHNELGHKGIYATCHTIADHFWWPFFNKDVAWYITTCSVEKVVILPVITTPTPLFCKAYVDSLHMPTAQGYSYIVQACCSFTGWLEWQKLKQDGTNIQILLIQRGTLQMGRIGGNSHRQPNTLHCST